MNISDALSIAATLIAFLGLYRQFKSDKRRTEIESEELTLAINEQASAWLEKQDKRVAAQDKIIAQQEERIARLEALESECRTNERLLSEYASYLLEGISKLISQIVDNNGASTSACFFPVSFEEFVSTKT